MYVAFDEIEDNARVWIYQADRKLSDTEAEKLENEAKVFTEQWAAHGTGLMASAKVFHHQFLILTVDESQHGASGCSIDSSVAFIRNVEQQYGINFFDRNKVAFLLNEEIYLESIQNLKNKIEKGDIASDTLTFNNLVATKGEMKEKWVSPAQNTWLARYF
ncbi:MAG: hypothetical protein OEX22_11650 [Cyclobacteriaceae bacterium]|nr:hypothetical protein [Cyclobacteriaceae bacterium]